jgi:hypothetical protein
MASLLALFERAIGTVVPSEEQLVTLIKDVLRFESYKVVVGPFQKGSLCGKRAS